MRSLRCTIVLLLIAVFGLHAQTDTTYLFYRPYDYGSMSMVSPWNVVLNGSYDVLQLDGKNRRIAELPYGKGLHNVWDNVVRHPGATISQIGWWKFLRTEVLPLTFNVDGGQWLPNYQLHLIGGGMTYRLLQEWYHYHGVDGAGWWAAGTVAAYHILNEMVEAEDYEGYNTDPIADILLFDWLGVLLFSNDDVARFFAEDLQMSDWSNLPMITFPGGELGNNGLYYALKWDVPKNNRWSLFYLMGMSNMLGASYHINAEHSVTLAAGARGKDLFVIDGRARVLTTELVPTGGIYWDRNNSLMASLTASGQSDQSVILQVYPGVADIFGAHTGFWATWGTSGTMGIGITLQQAIGVGYRGR